MNTEQTPCTTCNEDANLVRMDATGSDYLCPRGHSTRIQVDIPLTCDKMSCVDDDFLSNILRY